MTNLKWCFESFNYSAAVCNTVVNSREAVEHGTAFFDGFFDTVLCFFKSVLTCVAVDCGWEEVCAAFILEVFQKFDVFINKSNTCTWLDKCDTCFFSSVEFLCKVFVIWDSFLIFYAIFDFEACACWPLVENFFTNFVKMFVGPFFIHYFHLLLTPFS